MIEIDALMAPVDASTGRSPTQSDGAFADALAAVTQAAAERDSTTEVPDGVVTKSSDETTDLNGHVADLDIGVAELDGQLVELDGPPAELVALLAHGGGSEINPAPDAVPAAIPAATKVDVGPGDIAPDVVDQAIDVPLAVVSANAIPDTASTLPPAALPGQPVVISAASTEAVAPGDEVPISAAVANMAIETLPRPIGPPITDAETTETEPTETKPTETKSTVPGPTKTEPIMTESVMAESTVPGPTKTESIMTESTVPERQLDPSAIPTPHLATVAPSIPGSASAVTADALPASDSPITGIVATPMPSAAPESTPANVAVEPVKDVASPTVETTTIDIAAPVAQQEPNNTPQPITTPITAPIETIDPAVLRTPTIEAAVATESTQSSQPTGEPQAATPAQQVAEALRAVRRMTDGSHRLSLQLHPEDLGAIQLEVLARDGQLHVRAVAETEATRGLLNSSLNELRSGLADAGISAGSLEVGAETSGQQGTDREQSAARPRRNDPTQSDTNHINETPAEGQVASGRLDIRL